MDDVDTVVALDSGRGGILGGIALIEITMQPKTTLW